MAARRSSTKVEFSATKNSRKNTGMIRGALRDRFASSRALARATGSRRHSTHTTEVRRCRASETRHEEEGKMVGEHHLLGPKVGTEEQVDEDAQKVVVDVRVLTVTER